MSARSDTETPGADLRSDEALAQMHDSLRLQPRSEMLWKNLIKRYGQLGRHDEAIATARKWLEAMPDSGPAHFQMADLLVKEGLYETALKHLEHATGDPQMAIDAGLVIARTRMRMESLDSALRQTYQSLAESARFLPRHVNMIVALARQLHAWGQFKAVVDCCESVRARGANDPIWLALYASSLRQLGRAAESGDYAARFSNSLQFSPDAKIDHLRLARALWILERFDEALAKVREHLKIHPASPQAWQTLVRGLEKLERGDEALDAARGWLAALPGSEQANWHLARLMIGNGLHEEAKAHIENALVAATAAAEPAFEVVRAYLTRNEVKPAVELMERLIAAPERVVSRNASSIMRLARAFHGQRQYPVAENCCRAIARFCGNDPVFLALYGHILLSRGEVEPARELLERSVFMAPTSDQAPRLLLALSYIHHGNIALGRAYLSEATGFQEEGKILVELFGGAAPLIPYFGAEIDRSFAAS